MAGNTSGPECPPVLEKIDDPEQLLAQIVECLDFKDSRGLKTYILEHKLREESIYWELILKIGEKVSAPICEEDPAFFDVCNRCLVYLVKMGKPKEMLLAVLEQMDTFIDDVKYKCFLPLLQMSLFKISSKLFHSLDIALETVSAHIRGLKMPENVTLEGDERKLYHMDKEVVRLVDNVENFLDFLEPFVKSVALSGATLTTAKRNEALVLKKHLIRLFSFPLYHLDLSHDAEMAKTNSRLCVEKAMELLACVETDFQRLIASADVITDTDPAEKEGHEQCDESMKLEEEDYDNDENEKKLRETDTNLCEDENNDNDFVENWDFHLDVTRDAQACLAYILHVEHLGMDKYPQVYSHDFLFEFHLQSLTEMLKKTFYAINYKGLLLCKSLADQIMSEHFDAKSLDNPYFMTLINDLIHIMIKCPVRDHRTLATSLFTSVIKKFQEGGRYQIYQNILCSCSHSGVKGFVVTILKNDVSSFLSKTKMQTSTETHHAPLYSVFSGAKLKRIVTLASYLPDKETSDMLENSDQIISTLNFLRFLVVADPIIDNKTGFWNNVSEIEKNFLSPLRLGLDMSHAHYQLELKNVQEARESHDNSKGSKTEFTLSAAGVNLPSLEKGERINLIERALNTHQLMISLLCRLTELIDQNSKKKKCF